MQNAAMMLRSRAEYARESAQRAYAGIKEREDEVVALKAEAANYLAVAHEYEKAAFQLEACNEGNAISAEALEKVG